MTDVDIRDFDRGDLVRFETSAPGIGIELDQTTARVVGKTVEPVEAPDIWASLVDDPDDVPDWEATLVLRGDGSTFDVSQSEGYPIDVTRRSMGSDINHGKLTSIERAGGDGDD